MTTRSLFELDNEKLTRIAMTSRNSSQLVITRSRIYVFQVMNCRVIET